MTLHDLVCYFKIGKRVQTFRFQTFEPPSVYAIKTNNIITSLALRRRKKVLQNNITQNMLFQTATRVRQKLSVAIDRNLFSPYWLLLLNDDKQQTTGKKNAIQQSQHRSLATISFKIVDTDRYVTCLKKIYSSTG